MKKLLPAILILFLSNTLLAQNAKGFYFFSENDIENIHKSASSDWGKPIVDSLKHFVNERIQHPMEVPLLEGGHLHDYFCPIHNARFSFDWNKPNAQYCEFCQKYWTDKKFNWSWVSVVHQNNKDFLKACTYLFLATGDKKYAQYITDLLYDYSLKYPTFMIHNVARQQGGLYSGKMYSQSLDEAVFSTIAARAYLTVKGTMTSKHIEQIENGYLKPCAELLLRQKAGENWQVWHNGGIISLGVALGNDSIINVALNDPERGYYKLMELNVREDGWWNEGSPTYHFYPLEAMILSAEALRCRGINLYDKKLYNMFATPGHGVYASLEFPSHNDGWYGESLIEKAFIYEIAALRYNDPFLKQCLATIYRKAARTAPEALESNEKYSNKETTPQVRESINYSSSGIGLLCSGNKTVVLKYGPGGGIHGHPDKLSISIHDGKNEIVSDLGTTGYGVPDYKLWYKRTLSHSTLTVDGKDQNPSSGKLISFKKTKNGGEIEASANDAYENVNMQRSLKLKNNKLEDIFTANSPKEHTYDYVLIFTTKPQISGTFIPVELDDSEVYQRIKNIQKTTVNNILSFTVGKAKLTVESLDKNAFEVFIGEAPGIPHSKLSNPSSDKGQPLSYPLIIRSKNKNLKIKTIWELPN